ncbi:MAG: hypothetical protein LBK58_05395 [Prevotellaceae bacterium]|jgi:hypothetical protein|nr:hypothetical protein [Prevotellaceae bacterium]
MRVTIYCLIIIAFFCGCSHEEPVSDDLPSKEDLDARYGSQWNDEKYRATRTADAEDYLTREEQEIFYYLNLMRINPPLFAQTYVAGYNGDEGWEKGYAWAERKASLIAELQKMNPLPLLYPDERLYGLARCFASEGGKLGVVGHDRSQTGCATTYSAECCTYGGAENGLSIIMAFLIDAGENNGALEHRKICFQSEYVKLGASIQPHITYKINAVLNFGIGN